MKKRFHIIIDAWGVNKELLNNSDLILGVVKKLVELCDMKILFGPVILEGVPENPGITSFCVIDFSHISIHTFTDTQEVCIDVFSCKKFDYEKVKQYLADTFEMNPKKMYYKEVNYN